MAWLSFCLDFLLPFVLLFVFVFVRPLFCLCFLLCLNLLRLLFGLSLAFCLNFVWPFCSLCVAFVFKWILAENPSKTPCVMKTRIYNLPLYILRALRGPHPTPGPGAEVEPVSNSRCLKVRGSTGFPLAACCASLSAASSHFCTGQFHYIRRETG